MGKNDGALAGRIQFERRDSRPLPQWQSDRFHRASKARAPVLSGRSLLLGAAILEFILIAAAVFEAGAIYHFAVFGDLPNRLLYLFAAAGATGMFVISSGLARDYSIKRILEGREQLRSVFWRWTSACSLLVFVLFMTQATEFYSRGSIIVQYGAGLTAALIVRLLLTHFVARGLRSGSLRGNNVVVIGEAPLANHTVRKLRNDERGTRVVGAYTLSSPPLAASLDPLARDPAQVAEETASILAAVEALARTVQLDDIVINLPWSESERIRALVEGLAVVPATIHLAPDHTWHWARNPVLARVGRMHTMRLSRAPLTLKDQVLKRAFDITAASALLVAAAPLFAVIALLIKFDSAGPVLFRQRRHGFNQKEFRVFKFRTMNTLDDGPVVRQATRNDRRVTRIGRYLRKFNLDETPQLLNVLLGDMSLVGPRPHALAHNNQYEEQIRLYARRHNVKPGITGWAQINGLRGETQTVDQMHRRVEHDLYYIDHWSLFFDLKILLLTLFSLKSYRNAY